VCCGRTYKEVHVDTCQRIAELAYQYAVSGGVYTAAERFFIKFLQFVAGC
jgi:hypothetical protein